MRPFLGPCTFHMLTYKLFVGPAIEAILSSDEDEPSGNHLGQEAEDEGPFQFRRSTASQYQKVPKCLSKIFCKCQHGQILY